MKSLLFSKPTKNPDQDLLLFNPVNEKGITTQMPPIQVGFDIKPVSRNYYQNNARKEYTLPHDNSQLPKCITAHTAFANGIHNLQNIILQQVNVMITLKYNNSSSFKEEAKVLIAQKIYKNFILPFLLGAVQQAKHRSNAFLGQRYSITSIKPLSTYLLGIEAVRMNQIFMKILPDQEKYFVRHSEKPKFSNDQGLSKEKDEEGRMLCDVNRNTYNKFIRLQNVLPEPPFSQVKSQVENEMKMVLDHSKETTKARKNQKINMESPVLTQIRQNRLILQGNSLPIEVTLKDINKFLSDVPIIPNWRRRLFYKMAETF